MSDLKHTFWVALSVKGKFCKEAILLKGLKVKEAVSHCLQMHRKISLCRHSRWVTYTGAGTGG